MDGDSNGLGCFLLDVDLFQNIKIRKLIRRQGGKAVTVYVLLLCFIYKNGYYIGSDKDLLFIISEQTGYDEAYIQEVIKTCLSLGLFDRGVYETHNVLTSEGIQERYARTVSLLTIAQSKRDHLSAIRSAAGRLGGQVKRTFSSEMQYGNNNADNSVDIEIATRKQTVSKPQANRKQNASKPQANRKQNEAIRERPISELHENQQENLQANRKQTVSKTEANGKQTVSKTEAKQNQRKESEKEIPPFPTPLSSKEKDKEKERREHIAGACVRAQEGTGVQNASPTLSTFIPNVEAPPKPPREVFRPPTMDEVREYVRMKGYAVDAERFWYFYESKGWMVGKNKMKKWHAAVATWQKTINERNHATASTNQQGGGRGESDADFIARVTRQVAASVPQRDGGGEPLWGREELP